jgi:hypothetical protein
MAVTSDPFTAADLAAMIPEVWSDVVNEPNFPKAVAANFFVDLSEYMVDGADICHVPNIYTNVFTVSTQSTQGAEITTQGPAQVDTTLTVNTHSYIAFIIGDKDIAQLAKKYQLHDKYARECKNLLTRTLEDALFALWSSLSTNSVGDTATVLSDAEIRDSINALDTLDYDLNETAFFFHPFVFWTQLGGIAKYYQQYASNLNFIKDGNFGEMDASRGLKGQLYGIPVYTSTRIVNGLQTYRNIYAHRSAFGFALQTPGMKDEGGNGGRIRVQSEYALRNLGILTVVDMIYGVAVLREPAAVVVNANNAAKMS